MADADRPVGDLLRELSEQTTTLVAQELALAQAEMTEKAKRGAIGAGMFGGAAVVGLYALGALIAAVIVLLGTALAAWLAAVIVAVGLGLVAGVSALMGRSQVARATPPVPEQATESVKEDVEWAKTRANQARG
ncbi:MAG: phage holin family protein [Solirubrobacterales bacterium]|nr:phage holin family protein [Solirubrobacterales bacterium]